MTVLKKLKKHIEENYEFNKENVLNRYLKPIEPGAYGWKAYLKSLEKKK